MNSGKSLTKTTYGSSLKSNISPSEYFDASVLLEAISIAKSCGGSMNSGGEFGITSFSISNISSASSASYCARASASKFAVSSYWSSWSS